MRITPEHGDSDLVEVFADVACPFTHVGLRRLVAARRERGLVRPVFRVRAWPLEWVNGVALQGADLVPKVVALRAAVAPGLFDGFDQRTFPASTVPAMESEAAAYRCSAEVGERFSLAVRDALFEQGEDVSDPQVLQWIRRQHGVPEPMAADRLSVRSDFAEGLQRGVIGSPHFFTPHGDAFCPSLRVTHDDDTITVAFDERRFQSFADDVFGGSRRRDYPQLI